MGDYYDGTKLLSMKDADGRQPELYLCCTNRSAGKTTYFGRYFINRFKNYGEKFIILYRFNYELTDVADKFFKELRYLFFPDDVMTNRSRANGIYHELMLNDEICGWAISINSADSVKRWSHLFSDCCRVLFDEFQSETNHYCPQEVEKFQSIHASLARGKGNQVKYLPVFMLGNMVTLLNPYFTALGISTRLNIKTKFLKGHGFVLEQGFNVTASTLQSQSAFNQAFKGSAYSQFTSQKIYLNDNSAFVEQPTGRSRYLCTIKFDNEQYAVREFPECGYIYCDQNADETFRLKITLSADDHQINYVMLKKNDMFLNMLRWYFEHGAFRFKNLKCKDAILKACSYV